MEKVNFDMSSAQCDKSCAFFFFIYLGGGVVENGFSGASEELGIYEEPMQLFIFLPRGKTFIYDRMS